jgi:hypothetical protein
VVGVEQVVDMKMDRDLEVASLKTSSNSAVTVNTKEKV